MDNAHGVRVQLVSSMQWNRTIQLRTLNHENGAEEVKKIEVPKEVIEQVRAALKHELGPTDDLWMNITATISKKAKK